MRFAFVEFHCGDWPVRLMCRALGDSAGVLYDWRGYPPSVGHRRRESLAFEVEAIHRRTRARYGSPRIHAELAAASGRCSVNTVAKLMRERGIAAKAKRRFRRTADSNDHRPVAENVLGRWFDPGAVDRASASDITYIPTRAGKLYLAAVEDLHSRRIVGWSMLERIDSRLIVDALEMAIARRLPEAG